MVAIFIALGLAASARAFLISRPISACVWAVRMAKASFSIVASSPTWVAVAGGDQDHFIAVSAEAEHCLGEAPLVFRRSVVRA